MARSSSRKPSAPAAATEHRLVLPMIKNLDSNL
jgi:hypothetical protein